MPRGMNGRREVERRQGKKGGRDSPGQNESRPYAYVSKRFRPAWHTGDESNSTWLPSNKPRIKVPSPGPKVAGIHLCQCGCRDNARNKTEPETGWGTSPQGLTTGAAWLLCSHDLSLYPGWRKETQRRPPNTPGWGLASGVCSALQGTAFSFLCREIHPHVGKDFSLSISLWRR